ncbi:hypothetical protein HAX54_024618 [Datura stramonium]|uniref:J domain-containing protein n=1 Tax=Datura stramonium TaxID=4076 RepID=A0ABS8RGQ9_DATST|nr:hypothetical protein [Datura stramonium]
MAMEEVMVKLKEALLLMDNLGGQGLLKLVNFSGQPLRKLVYFGGQGLLKLVNFGGQLLPKLVIFCGQGLLKLVKFCGQLVLKLVSFGGQLVLKLLSFDGGLLPKLVNFGGQLLLKVVKQLLLKVVNLGGKLLLKVLNLGGQLLLKLVSFGGQLLLKLVNFGGQGLLKVVSFGGQLLPSSLKNFCGQVPLMLKNFDWHLLLMFKNFGGQAYDDFSWQVKNLCGRLVNLWDEVFQPDLIIIGLSLALFIYCCYCHGVLLLKVIDLLNAECLMKVYHDVLVLVEPRWRFAVEALRRNIEEITCCFGNCLQNFERWWSALRDQLELATLGEEGEAKKLKQCLKRKTAESERFSEIEKRQKQRVEELRETQKKDVENMNLKERIRAEVGKELGKLEMTCHDMASLLDALGITVGDGTSHEVRVAYKKALMKFHPDRALRSDIRLQVKAEEKFKLISRMKDK